MKKRIRDGWSKDYKTWSCSKHGKDAGVRVLPSGKRLPSLVNGKHGEEAVQCLMFGSVKSVVGSVLPTARRS